MADFEKKLGYTAGGADPEEIKTKGFQAGYKPPASYFNWLFTRISECIDELQTFGSNLKAKHNEDVTNINTTLNGKWNKVAVAITEGTLDTYTAIGTYVYSMGNSPNIGNTPEVAQSTMLVFPRLMPDSTSDRVQIVFTQNNSMYIRNLIGGVWNDWRKLFKNDDIVPLENGGTGVRTVKDARNVFNLPETCVTITDWNDAVKSGWYMGNNTQNSPSEGWHFGFVLAHNESYVFQEVYRFSQTHTKATEVDKYIRSKHNGNWTEWAKVTVQRTVLESAKLEYITTLRGDVQDQIDNKLNLKPPFIEFSTSENASNGGYLDFHFNGSEEDYTSRIIEKGAGYLSFEAIRTDFGGRINAPAYGGAIHTSGTATDYAVEIKGLTELINGLKITIIPHVDATTSTAVTLAVNGLGAKPLRHNSPLLAHVPVTLTYSSAYSQWFADVSPTAKPSGSYNGNGSNAKRTINTGGIGNVLFIWAVTTSDLSVTQNVKTYVLPTGAVAFGNDNASDRGVSSNEMKYENGVLTIANNYHWFNQSGVTYYYQCL